MFLAVEVDRVEPRQIDEYWRRFAQAFAHPLQANGLLGEFISNPCVTGAYAEAWVRSLAEQMVAQPHDFDGCGHPNIGFGFSNRPPEVASDRSVAVGPH
jgi:hypothetical protein